METLLSVAVGIIIILVYSTINLFTKNEKLEDVVVSQQTYIDRMSELIQNSDEKLKEIDEAGTFASDDEVGFFFNNLKEMQSILNQLNDK